jgi:hypothetical protein
LGTLIAVLNLRNVGTDWKTMQKRRVGLLSALGLALGTLPLLAHATCNTITAPTLTLVAVDCTLGKVWTTLQASGQFPDVFFPPGKTMPICYASSSPASASIGQHQVTITSTLSGWTTDLVPTLFGGQDNLGTVVTQLTVTDQTGNYTGKLFTRDTIDLSKITTTGSAAEQDVIVGGTNNFGGAKGTYRVDSAANQDASMVILTNLHGILCTNN